MVNYKICNTGKSNQSIPSALRAMSMLIKQILFGPLFSGLASVKILTYRYLRDSKQVLIGIDWYRFGAKSIDYKLAGIRQNLPKGDAASFSANAYYLLLYAFEIPLLYKIIHPKSANSYICRHD